MDLSALNATAEKLVTPGKGLLAADESTSTIQKRFDAIGVENTEQNRRDYREILFRAAEGMSYVSGVILFRETLYQDAADGTPLVELIERAGAAPGIKVDLGAKPMAGFPGETLTEGLDGLGAQLAKDYERGARFAKWRAALYIGDGLPSWGAVKANAHALARYAAVCQEQGLTPIVEPEVLMEGDHDIGFARPCRCVRDLGFQDGEVHLGSAYLGNGLPACGSALGVAFDQRHMALPVPARENAFRGE